MTATDWVQAIATVVLVVVTIFYAYQAKKASDSAKASAEAGVKMADEMKEQRLAMYKPHILLKNVSVSKGKYFMREIGIEARNEQGGTAINVKIQVHHPLFKFQTHRYPFSVSVGQVVECGCHVESPSVEEDSGKPIDPVALVIANYEDVSGNPWHSVLELHWDATSKDITPGSTKVAASGHLESGKNIK